MPHTAQTTTNQIKHPAATIVRSMETSFVSVPWAKSRMRRNVCQGLVDDMVLGGTEVCGVWQPRHVGTLVTLKITNSKCWSEGDEGGKCRKGGKRRSYD